MIDLAIIGGGPAGYVAAERAGAKGLSVMLFEKRELGGVCLNEGCIPTKALLYSAKVLDGARSASKYGVSAGEVSFDYGKIIDRKVKTVRRLVAGVGAKMKAHNVEVVKGLAAIEGREGEAFVISCDGNRYEARNLLVCTGSEAAVPPIAGLAEAGDIIITSREILSLRERPERLVIVGGGVIGMEFASFFNSVGTEVTVIEMLPEILGGFDTEISAMLRAEYTKKGVKFNLGCRVNRIGSNGEVFYSDPEGTEHSVAGDKILVSIGRRPVTAGLGLENIGVTTERGAVKVDDRMRTNVPGVYAAGDVTGFSMLAHTASREGEVVVNNLTGGDDSMSYDAVPGVVYTNPEVAMAGMTAAMAVERGIEIQEIKLPMTYAGRFMVENEGGNGLCKIVVNSQTKEVLGMHMIGNPSSEMIFGACMAIEQKMTLGDLEKIIFPHPTVSEIIKETAFMF